MPIRAHAKKSPHQNEHILNKLAPFGISPFSNLTKIECALLGISSFLNVLKQTEQEVVYDQASFNKNVLSPYYKSHKILNEDLVIVEKYKDFVSLDKPVQIASAILELAKYTMYNYYYNVLLPAYNNRVELIYTDTDR